MSDSNERLKYNYIEGAATTGALIMAGPLTALARPISSPEVAGALEVVGSYTSNMGLSVALANTAAIGYTIYRNHQEAAGGTMDRRYINSVPDKQLWRDRHKLTAVVVGAAALANAVVETRWGVQLIPGVEMTPDAAPTWSEMLAGSAAGALVVNALWSRKRRHATRPDSRHRSMPSHVA